MDFITFDLDFFTILYLSKYRTRENLEPSFTVVVWDENVVGNERICEVERKVRARHTILRGRWMQRFRALLHEHSGISPLAFERKY